MRRTLAAIVACMALAGCVTSNKPPADRPEISNTTEWYTITDPVNGLTFRCHKVMNRTYGYDIYTEWCYGPVTTELEIVR